ncbi:MAG: iron-sulfur cluster assembly accessory protein [Proteobacteria bacterium]|nr:iron-sulfur cluster assembly accessory protein [Pseudomonadota bacterium]
MTESEAKQAPTSEGEPKVLLTENAAKVVLEAFTDEKVDPSKAYLRIGAHPGGCSGYMFDMDYGEAEQVTGEDTVFVRHGVNIVVNSQCLNDILGSVEIDYQTGSMMERGFKFRRLINGALCGCGESFAPIKPTK